MKQAEACQALQACQELQGLGQTLPCTHLITVSALFGTVCPLTPCGRLATLASFKSYLFSEDLSHSLTLDVDTFL